MKTSSFQFQRFFQFLKTEIYRNKKSYYSFIIINIAATILILIPDYYVNSTSVDNVGFVGKILILFCPFAFYKFLYHKSHGLNYAILPVSIEEKLAAAITQCSIIMPILIILSSLLVYSLSLALGTNIDFNYNRSFFEDLLDILVLQSYSIFSVFWFRKNKLGNSIMLFCMICIGITIIVSFLTYNIYQNWETYNTSFLPWNQSNAFETSAYFLNALIVLTCWGLSYHKLRKTQI